MLLFCGVCRFWFYLLTFLSVDLVDLSLVGQNRDLIAELDLKVQMQWVIRIMDGIIMDR